MSPELLKAIHMADAQETAVVNAMMNAPEWVWDDASSMTGKMMDHKEDGLVRLIGMLAQYGWTQARVKVA